jgi:hypothetical protein
MKISKLLVFLSLFLACASGSALAAMERGPFAPDAEKAIRETLEQCLVRPFGIRSDGSRVFGHYQSSCAGVIRDGRAALVPLSATAGSDQGWEVRLIGSEYSDGGDLCDVAVWDDKGHLVMESQRVLAFGDPLEALTILTGAHPQSSIHDPELDEQR